MVRERSGIYTNKINLTTPSSVERANLPLNQLASSHANSPGEAEQGSSESNSDRERRDSRGEEKYESLKKIEEHLQTKYLPLQLLSMLMARAAVDIMRFSMHRGRTAASSSEQVSSTELQTVWDICIRLLEQRDMLPIKPSLEKIFLALR